MSRLENITKDICGRLQSPAILTSNLLLQTHARQLCSLALTRVIILLNSWVLEYECIECMECNWNRECQPRTFPVHVAFDVILRLHSASSELRSVLPWPQAWSESVVRASPEKHEVRDCCLWYHWSVERERCSFLERVFTLIRLFCCIIHCNRTFLPLLWRTY